MTANVKGNASSCAYASAEPHAPKSPKAPPPATIVNAFPTKDNPTAATQISINVRSSLSSLSEAARQAFLGQTTLAETLALGARTKAPGVVREAGQCVSTIASARSKFDESAVRYGSVRVAYLCDGVLGLADPIEAARDRDPSSPQLVPGSATRTILGTHSRHDKPRLVAPAPTP